MRKKLTAIFAAVTMFAAAIPPIAATAADAPIEYTFDADGESYELVGNAVIAEGKNGSGLYLDGNASYALLDEDIITDEMTISMWIRFDSLSAWMRAFDFGSDTSNNFFLAPSYARAEVHSPSRTDTLDFDGETSTGWVYYTVTATSSEVRVYKNGQLTAEMTGLNNPLTSIANKTNYLGKSHYDTDPYFKGTIDEVKIYDRVLTAEEIFADATEYMDETDLETTLDSCSIDDGTVALGSSIELKTLTSDNVNVTWSSSDPSIIDASGNITGGDTAATVILTETATIGEATASREYTVYVPAANEAPFTISIDADDRSKDVNDNMWGLFFEDINSAADGGLYAELVQNCSFEYPENLYCWTVSDGVETIADENAMNENNPTYIAMTANAYISNAGYMEKMSVTAGEEYNFSMYVLTSTDEDAQFEVSLGGATATVTAPATVTTPENEESVPGVMVCFEGAEVPAGWTKVECTLVPTETTLTPNLTITNTGSATAYVDYVSLMSSDTYKGHGLRRDLCEAIEALEPKFLRFPGGCAVEGLTMDLAWNWKDTVGALPERKQTENIWNTGSEPYIMSYGLGFYEYFQLCEDMGMEAIPIINCGIACQVRSGDSREETYLVPLDELEPYIQDAIDLIAFANGTDETNEWTALRIEMGHPEPFNIKYIGIGNEQYGSVYFERYALFAEALREAYPDMELNLVTTSGTASSGTSNEYAWKWVNANNDLADIVDEHYYESADWFRAHAYRYDNYSRDTAKVFLGEYASKGNTWYNALSEAAFMTGLERNADVVRMASYAPLFAKFGNTQWTAADMIWFNDTDYVLTPNYYVQKLFSTNSGDYTLPTEVDTIGASEDAITGGVAVGTWKTSAEYKDIVVTDENGEVLVSGFDSDAWQTSGGEWTLTDGVLSQTNSEEENCLFWLAGDYENYTITLKARKTGGKEGFLVGTGVTDAENHYWANIGGWTNTAAKIQQTVAGTTATQENTAETDLTSTIEIAEGEWYDITVTAIDGKISAYVNDELVCSYNLKKEYGPIYSSAVYDETAGEYIVKVVNTSDSDTSVRITLDGAETVSDTAAVEYIAADTTATNSLSDKYAVVPETTEISGVSNDFEYAVKANSVNVIHIGTGTYSKEIGGLTVYYDANGKLTGTKIK